jgi:hypothetical protein
MHRRMVKRAVTAGLAGGIVLDAYLWLTTVLPARQSIAAALQYVASTVFGSVAFTGESYAAAGLAISLLVSIGWAGGYAYFTNTHPATNRHWIAAGAAYGVVVFTLMQLILLGSGRFVPPSNPTALVNSVVAYVVFFGVPVAYVVRSLSLEAIA